MAFRLRKRRHYTVVTTSDSETDIPLYKKERLQRVKGIKDNLKTLCDNDSLNESNSDNDMLLKQRTGINGKTVTGRNNDQNRKKPFQFRSRLFDIDSDSSTTDAFEESIRNQTKNKKNAVVEIDSDDNSHDSSVSLFVSKKKFLEQSNINKQDKKNNNEKVFCETSNNKDNTIKSNKTKDVHDSQVIETESNEENCNEENRNEENHNEENCNEENIVPSIQTKDNQEVQEKKQKKVHVNFKPYIIKVMEEVKYKFTKFKAQITSLQQKFLKDEIISLKDAKDIIFILTCIISKLKEEFTEHQRDLMDSCVQWSMKHRYTHSIMGMENAQIFNNNDLQVQSKTSTAVDIEEEIFTPRLRKQPLRVRKIVACNIQLSDTNSIPCKNNITNNNILKINGKTDRITGSIQNPNKISDSSDKKLIEQKLETKRDVFENLLNTERNDISNYDSDIDSTCSTFNLRSSEGLDEQQNNEINAAVNMDISESDDSDVLYSPFHNDKRSINRTNSEKTTVLANNKTTDVGKHSCITDKTRLPRPLNTEDLTNKVDSKSSVPNKNNSTKNSRLKYRTDKKLRMKCKVLVKKCKL